MDNLEDSRFFKSWTLQWTRSQSSSLRRPTKNSSDYLIAAFLFAFLLQIFKLLIYEFFGFASLISKIPNSSNLKPHRGTGYEPYNRTRIRFTSEALPCLSELHSLGKIHLGLLAVLSSSLRSPQTCSNIFMFQMELVLSNRCIFIGYS